MASRAGLVAGSTVAASLAGMPVAFVFGATGLLVAEDVMVWLGFPVAFLATGFSAGLASAWAANALAPDRSRSRLGIALGWGGLAGLAGAVLFILLFVAAGGFAGGPYGSIMLPVAFAVTIVPIQPVTRIRDKKRPLKKDAWWSFAFLLLIGAAWYGIVGLACLMDKCGA